MKSFNLLWKFLKVFFKKHNFIYYLDNSLLVRVLLPPKESDKYKRSIKKLKRLGITKSFERIMTYKLLIIIFTFSLLISFNIYYTSYANKQSLLVNNDTSTVSLSNLTSKNNTNNDTNMLIIRKTIELEPNYKRLIKENKNQELINIIFKAEDYYNIKDTTGDFTKNIFLKFYNASNVKLHLINIVLFFLISILMSGVINIYFMIISSIRQAKVEKEFKLMELITIILIKNSDITVEEILNVQRDYTTLLKDQYKKCLIEYPRSKIGAIDKLIKDVDNDEFNMFMSIVKENLKSDSETNIKLLEAQKNLNYELDEERYREKLNKYSIFYTVLSFQIWFIALVALFYPVLSHIKNSF